LEKNPNTTELYDENPVIIEAQESTVCDVCGEEFKQPLLAELISGDHTEEYYACPRCLTRVGEVERQEKVEVDEAEEEGEEEVVEITEENEAAKTGDSPACPYYLGYLRKRQKNSPIPETCFTCIKMIDCTH